MNLVNGKIISAEECDTVLENIDAMLEKTLSKPPLDIRLVINACDWMVKNIDGFEVTKRLPELGISPVLAEIYLKQIEHMLSKDAINKRLCTELGVDFDMPKILTYMHSGTTAIQTIAPLGVLFHITAGNVDGLPFISLLDGLLTGNINIVKLPKEEGGITVQLLQEMFKIAPSLCEYVYVFDYSSKDISAMQKFAKAADAIVVWGGDEAVSAVRRLADPNTKIIEWGHKISFAYVAKDGITEEALEKLAYNICFTNQLFCSSCQGIFLDTDDMNEVHEFCQRFLSVLERVSGENPFMLDAAAQLFIQAEVTLTSYHKKIEGNKSGCCIFRGTDCSVTAYTDSKLEASMMYRNPWVKPLKRENIIGLRKYKSYLQTAALICSGQDRAELSQRLIKAGLIKVSDGLEMSNYALGESHDGIFTLRAYTKIVSQPSE